MALCGLPALLALPPAIPHRVLCGEPLALGEREQATQVDNDLGRQLRGSAVGNQLVLECLDHGHVQLIEPPGSDPGCDVQIEVLAVELNRGAL